MTNWSRRRVVRTAIAVSTVGLAGCGLPGGEDGGGGENGGGEEDGGGEGGGGEEGTEGEDGEESDARSSPTFAPDE